MYALYNLIIESVFRYFFNLDKQYDLKQTDLQVSAACFVNVKCVLTKVPGYL